MAAASQTIKQQIWEGCLPLQINLSKSECRVFDKADPYFISFPRLSYLPFLLPRLLDFFKPYLIGSDPVYPYQGWFSFEGLPLKWHYPVGLLYDLYASTEPAPEQGDDKDRRYPCRETLPWKLTLHFQDWPDQELVGLDEQGRVMHDFFMNSVKEADFVRNGTGKSIMTLSREDSNNLWTSIQERSEKPSIKVVQSQFPPKISTVSAGTEKQIQTIGTALHSVVPSLFPDDKDTNMATPILHGAAVPMSAPLEEMARCAAYADGWLNIVVWMHG
ncbi:autophagy protein Apg5, putative [Trichophyton benhamiae CBS 112371]|uniref:Autophagy protein 5 n=1 Tax=Arthroderma benhamiae (strain ATCC MYA-4681 / CBS 112371) TaxID=663331 RepID=D4AZ14_ARTBC|nr:autophagy protein Apg5, putative [Trichophyton benhamiae CBS 112371]EFE31834.1 autophagy protein Apg5, putative [Trichophyton benhamiae CBS 112371]